MNEQTKANFEKTILKFEGSRRRIAIENINSLILQWSNGNWTTRRPVTPTHEIVADVIFDELEGNRSDGWQTFSVSDFLENWDDFVSQEGCECERVG